MSFAGALIPFERSLSPFVDEAYGPRKIIIDQKPKAPTSRKATAQRNKNDCRIEGATSECGPLFALNVSAREIRRKPHRFMMRWFRLSWSEHFGGPPDSRNERSS